MQHHIQHHAASITHWRLLVYACHRADAPYQSSPSSSSTAFWLVTQLFLLTSEQVKAAKCLAIQFVALVQSGICPRVIHSATSLPRTESESRRCLFHHSALGCLCSHLPVGSEGSGVTNWTHCSILPQSQPQAVRLKAPLTASTFLV